MSVKIAATVSGKIGFASHQNAVPVLKELELFNDSEVDYNDLTLEVLADPPFLESRTWCIDRLSKQSSLQISERQLKLNAGYLAELTESLRGDLTLRLICNEETLISASFPVEILAKNEWGGVGAMAELLAAFSMPNDPAVDRILKSTSEVLRRAGKKDGIDGYKGQSRTRTWELASAVWSAVCGLKLSYALPPASFENQGQKIRTPSLVLGGGVATCLDSALLFSAAFEQAGLNPLVIITKGHAFVGVWLQPQEFSQVITDDAGAVRKRIDLKELVVFETTLATQAPVPSFSQAVGAAERQLANDNDFVMAFDIQRARMQRVRPLAFSNQLSANVEDVQTVPNEALEEAPTLPGFDVELSVASETPADRLMLWQRKLLDLTTRNRLLHLPESAKAVRLMCPEPAKLEDQLADGKSIRIVPMPDLQASGRDAALYEQQNRESLYEEYAKTALNRGEVVAPIEKVKLEAALIDLYRKSKSDLDEGGANTLFLAVGFLKWKKTADDPKSYSAPLILLPVKLDRKSALSGVTMTLLDDEARFNMTLLELLRHDFELIIPGLDGELPTDESGIDVAGIWNTVRRAVRDVPGFEVTNEVALGTFSFAKYLMWKDLADRSAQLMQSPLVKHLLERVSGSGGFGSSEHFPTPEQLDKTISLANLFVPLAADSSQLAAIVASASGHDFVLDGPPGTGKSQTIANMIAHNLALGRRVLFVAEKMAALDVVYRRLEEKGLGEFCLELHSSKTSKVEVLKQLERAWDVRDTLSAEEWHQEATKAGLLRDKLNGIVEVLHRRWPNGLTVHQAIGRVIRDAADTTPRFTWKNTQHELDAYTGMQDVARRLDLNSRAPKELAESFGLINRADWSNGWQEAIVAAATELSNAIDAMNADNQNLLKATKLTLKPINNSDLSKLIELASLCLDANGLDFDFIFKPDVRVKIDSARQSIALLEEYHFTEKSLSKPYLSEACKRINIVQFSSDWNNASQKFWILATLAKKKVGKQLAVQGGFTGLPDTANDLLKLTRMHTLAEELDAMGSRLQGIAGWAGLSSNSVQIEKVVILGEQIRASISTLASSQENLSEIRNSVSRLLLEGNELLGSDGFISSTLSRLKESFTRYQNAIKDFNELIKIDGEKNVIIESLRSSSQAIVKQRAQLKSWCDWCRVRDEAIAYGLQPLTNALAENSIPEGGVAKAFETAYARWFAAMVIDSEPLLCNFVPAEHMSDIETFRRLDDQLSKLSVRYIRAKLCGLIPSKNEIGKQGGGFSILKHELQKSRRHKPVRQLAVEMGDAMTKLAPCMLMSPLSIAQYLPTDQMPFDLVIFDEASQIAPWDAIGSIARGKNVVIAGDPRQMPPTAFFNRAASAGDDDTEEDMESILDECLGAGVRSHSLSWHYRSRHESLIAFSNNRYYDSNLITFPAPETRPSAVEWRKINGVYAKGKGRHNQAEAEAIVAETVKRLLDPVFVASGQSIGIITLNTDQQSLITDLLDRARQHHPEIEHFFQDGLAEPVVVKNLETVQGDERDLIILGIGFGPTEVGAPVMSMNFGPLNKDGGWRRLNVAITRARREMLVFTSFDPSMVDLNRTNARAVRDLKHFIDFAKRGPRALTEAIKGSVGSYDSPFEEAVAQGLRRKGWEVVPQIGVSRFRIDLGVVHPDRGGDYLAGIECDGATYHSAATARDRDKVRGAILQGLGWTLIRLWSTEWWTDKEGALERMDAALNALLDASRLERPILVISDEGVVVSPANDERMIVPSAVPTNYSDVVTPHASMKLVAGFGGRDFPLSVQRAPNRSEYRIADFSGLRDRISAERFYTSEYDETLSDLIEHVLQQEAPILSTLLMQRIARAHGFQRVGNLIRDRILAFVERKYHLQNGIGKEQFIWHTAQDVLEWNRYRVPSSDQDMRLIEEISFEELRVAAATVQSEDKALEVARLLGIKRLTTPARSRIELALSSRA